MTARPDYTRAPIRLPAGNASAWTGPAGNNTYLLLGPSPAIVDAGVGNPAHVEAIAVALGPASLASILVTHGHSDHASGLPALAARWPSARAIRYPDVSTGSPPVDAGSIRLTPLHTPGHAPDHLSFFDEASGDLFCGDLARTGGTIVIPASRGGHLAQYLASLRAIRELRPRRLLPGHGEPVDDPDALIDRYLRHREERESQVLQALADGDTTPERIAERLHGRLAAGLQAAAADSVLAHLVKLQEEGRADVVDGGWRLG